MYELQKERGGEMRMKFNIMKTLLAGTKTGVITFLSLILAVFVGSLGFAQGYHPSGEINNIIMTYIVVPFLGFIIGALNNFIKHKND